MSRILDIVKSNNPLVEELLTNVSVKNVKEGFGHDLMGVYADIYLKGHGKIGYLNNDGWGGESEQRFTSKEKETAFREYLESKNFAKFLFENGWDFMKDVKKITFHSQVDELLEYAIQKKNIEKHLKAIARDCKKGICYGTEESYYMTTWKGWDIARLLANPKGRASVKNAVIRIKSEMKKGEKILNTNLDGLE